MTGICGPLLACFGSCFAGSAERHSVHLGPDLDPLPFRNAVRVYSPASTRPLPPVEQLPYPNTARPTVCPWHAQTFLTIPAQYTPVTPPRPFVPPCLYPMPAHRYRSVRLAYQHRVCVEQQKHPCDKRTCSLSPWPRPACWWCPSPGGQIASRTASASPHVARPGWRTAAWGRTYMGQYRGVFSKEQGGCRTAAVHRGQGLRAWCPMRVLGTRKGLCDPPNARTVSAG